MGTCVEPVPEGWTPWYEAMLGQCWRAAAVGSPQESVQGSQYCGRDPCGAGAESDYGGAAETKVMD